MAMSAHPDDLAHVLEFDGLSHTYRVDGQAVPSVTQLLEAAGVSPDYRKVHPAILQHARLRGIHIDAACDLDDVDDLDWSSVSPEAVGYIQGWQAFKADYQYEPVISQPPLYHPVYGYCGTPDSIGMLDGQVVVVERKATAKMAASYALQTAGYGCNGMHIAPRGGGRLEPVPWGGPVMRLGVHLQPGGRYELVEYSDPDDESAWLGVVALARWRKARR
jgi:hypothetical protein